MLLGRFRTQNMLRIICLFLSQFNILNILLDRYQIQVNSTYRMSLNRYLLLSQVYMADTSCNRNPFFTQSMILNTARDRYLHLCLSNLMHRSHNTYLLLTQSDILVKQGIRHLLLRHQFYSTDGFTTASITLGEGKRVSFSSRHSSYARSSSDVLFIENPREPARSSDHKAGRSYVMVRRLHLHLVGVEK